MHVINLGQYPHITAEQLDKVVTYTCEWCRKKLNRVPNKINLGENMEHTVYFTRKRYWVAKKTAMLCTSDVPEDPHNWRAKWKEHQLCMRIDPRIVLKESGLSPLPSPVPGLYPEHDPVT